MTTRRALPSVFLVPTLLALAAATACAELDPDSYEELSLEELDADLEFSEGELDSPALDPESSARLDGFAAPEDDERTVSLCDLDLPDIVYGDNMNQGTASGVLSGIASGDYYFQVTALSGPTLQYWLMSIEGVLVDSSVSALWPPFHADDGDTMDLFMQAFNSAQPGDTFEFEVELYSSPGDQLICSDTTTFHLPDCDNVGWWSTNPWPTPWFDNANCFVEALPVGATSFVWNNSWYVLPTSGTQCAAGVWDGANCYIGSAPGGQTAFIWNGAMYFTP